MNQLRFCIGLKKLFVISSQWSSSRAFKNKDYKMDNELIWKPLYIEKLDKSE